MGEIELGEFKEGRPYGRVTIYGEKDVCYNQVIEDPELDWTKQRLKPVKIHVNELWKAYYRKDMIAQRSLGDYDETVVKNPVFSQLMLEGKLNSKVQTKGKENKEN